LAIFLHVLGADAVAIRFIYAVTWCMCKKLNLQLFFYALFLHYLFQLDNMFQMNQIQFSHVGHTGTHMITKVNQRLAWIVFGQVTTQMTSMPGTVRRCTRVLCPGKATEKTPRGVIFLVYLNLRKTRQERKWWKRILQWHGR
jgi:hypothetical protein